MAEAEPTGLVIEHAIGPTGRFLLAVPRGSVVVRGVEGDTVRLRAMRGSLSLPIDASRVEVARTPESLVVRFPGGTRLGIEIEAFGRRLASGGDRYEVEVEVPAGARVEVDTTSADVAVTGLTGSQRYHTVSGDLELSDVAGGLALDVTSGDATVRATGPLVLEARSVSGDLDITAPRLDGLRVNTISGDVRLAGVLSPERGHVIETVSGGVRITSGGSLTVMAQTISGDISSDLPHRSGGGPGRRSMVIGNGRAQLSFHSISGDLAVAGTRETDDAWGFAAETAPAAADAPRVEEDRLAILRQVERGELDVTEAAARLAALEGPHDA